MAASPRAMDADPQLTNDWEAEITEIDLADVVLPEIEQSIWVDVSNDITKPWWEFVGDHCQFGLIQAGVDVLVRILLDGDVVASTSECVDVNASSDWRLDYQTPSDPGFYPLTIEVLGTNTGEVKAATTRTIEVVDTSDEECAGDEDCPPDLVCVDGHCVAPPPGDGGDWGLLDAIRAFLRWLDDLIGDVVDAITDLLAWLWSLVEAILDWIQAHFGDFAVGLAVGLAAAAYYLEN